MPLKKLKTEEIHSTDDLITQIERKDRNFRMAQTLFMISTFVALAIVIGFQNSTLNGLDDQLSQAKKTAETQDRNATEARDRIIRRLDCMTVFFSQTDRTNLSIADIDRCTLNRNGDLQQFFTQKPGEPPQTTPTEQPPNLTNSTPSQGGGGANPTNPTTPIEPPVIPPGGPPTTILDLLQGTMKDLQKCQINNIVNQCR